MKPQKTLRRVLNTGSFLATWMLGILGAATLSWLIFSAFTGATIVIFKTGSMSPTMPEGSAAIILPTAAADLSIGDVVTVQRDHDSLPVTHRIIDSHPVVTEPIMRELTLQGDANQVPDQHPYRVASAGKVVMAVPAVGNVILTLQSPLGLGILTITSAALIVIAFWPHQNPSKARKSEHDEESPSPEPQPATAS